MSSKSIGDLYWDQKEDIIWELETVGEKLWCERVTLRKVLVSEDGSVSPLLQDAQFRKGKEFIRWTMRTYNLESTKFTPVSSYSVASRIKSMREEKERLRLIEVKREQEKAVLRIADSLETIASLLAKFVPVSINEDNGRE